MLYIELEQKLTLDYNKGIQLLNIFKMKSSQLTYNKRQIM